MVRTYRRKTNQRPREERHLSVRAEHRESPDVDKLTELLIRFTLQETGQRRVQRSSSRGSVTGTTGSA
ncbi:hypothetical protein [Schaalia sp. JY-X159]|uniref:hypothetical protein n=1 Tax=Schaalia sp. JY-X159 TaxID=2758575 RepID=UPI001CB6DB10|nr:hypothetical protein [Schaalia sp. JY-X159]